MHEIPQNAGQHRHSSTHRGQWRRSYTTLLPREKGGGRAGGCG
uniref:Uncharacterized protein n=1 Tax=Anguilla anguilla TaxID=7936 RepID=A0A0E9W079_ANGAN